MKIKILFFILYLLLLLPYGNAYGILINLSDEDMAAAIATGAKQGSRVSAYLKQHYRFGNEDVFAENGIIRTKWSKLALLSGLLAAKGSAFTDHKKNRIIKSTELQIDIHTFGDTIDFADSYRVLLKQKNKTIEPDKYSINHATFFFRKRTARSGFPKYRATISSHIPYGRIRPNDKAEIILIKEGKKKVFEIDFALYK